MGCGAILAPYSGEPELQEENLGLKLRRDFQRSGQYLRNAIEQTARDVEKEKARKGSE